MVRRRYTFKIYPNATQAARLREVLYLHQQLYNAALQERREAWRTARVSVSCFNQGRQLTEIRAEQPEYAALSRAASTETLRRLDKAFKAFFQRAQAGNGKAGFPRFKALARYPGWGYGMHGNGWKMTGADKQWSLRLIETGPLKLRGRVAGSPAPRSLVIRHRDGRWYASVVFDVEPKGKAGARAVGIDWGLTTYGTIASDGAPVAPIKNPRILRQSLASLKRAQRAVSRKKRGSRNRQKARQLVAARWRKVRTRRANFLHQTSHHLVRKVGLIATEELRIKNMVREGGAHKRGLNRAILDAAPGEFFQLLRYKAESAGVLWFDVPTRKVKPSQTCSACGRREKKTLAERVHSCPCGLVCGRDENAARVMLNWALARLKQPENPAGVEGAVTRPLKREVGAFAPQTPR